MLNFAHAHINVREISFTKQKAMNVINIKQNMNNSLVCAWNYDFIRHEITKRSVLLARSYQLNVSNWQTKGILMTNLKYLATIIGKY